MKIITRAVLEWSETKGRYITVEEESFDYDGPLSLCHKPSAPPPPDPYATAAAQTQQNQQSANYNAAIDRVNTYTPYGSQTYTVTGNDPSTGAPIYRSDTNLSPEQQKLFDQQQQQNLQLGNISQGVLGQVQSAYSTPFDYGSIEDLRNKTQGALYDQNTGYLDPQFQRGQSSLDTKLANQGVTQGSEAYNNAYQDFNQSKEVAYRQARDQSIAGGGAEADRALQQAMTLRNQPLDEFNALRGSSPVNVPNQTPAAQVNTNPADISSNIYGNYQGQLDQYNAKVQQQNALYGGLFGLGASAITAGMKPSDERVKDNIEPVGELASGDTLYSFTYKGDSTPQVGVMAQDIEKVDPKAVHTFGGVKHVDYSRVMARALEASHG